MKKSATISMNNKFQTLLGIKHPQLKIGFAVPALPSIKTVF